MNSRYRTTLIALSLLALAALTAPSLASAAGFEPISAKRFKLEKRGLTKSYFKRADQLRSVFSKSSVGAVLADTNRKTRPLIETDAVDGVGATTGYLWNQGDNAVDYWTPQGMSGTSDAAPTGKVAGHVAHVVSWYSSNGKGVRVSFVKADRIRKATYRHVLLVRPTGGSHFANVPIHAGGIAWMGRWLYVADTKVGLRVFDTARIMRVPDKRLKSTGNYRYVLPQVGYYANTGKKLSYSFVAADRSQGAPKLLAGTYSQKAGKPLVRFTVNPRTGLLAQSRATSAWRMPVGQVQGAMSLNGSLLASSSATSTGRLFVGRPRGRVGTYQWGLFPEDLYSSPGTSRIWSLTEKPGHRSVFAIKRSRVGL